MKPYYLVHVAIQGCTSYYVTFDDFWFIVANLKKFLSHVYRIMTNEK